MRNVTGGPHAQKAALSNAQRQAAWRARHPQHPQVGPERRSREACTDCGAEIPPYRLGRPRLRCPSCTADKSAQGHAWRLANPALRAAYNLSRRHPVRACTGCGGPSDKQPGPGRYHRLCAACRAVPGAYRSHHASAVVQDPSASHTDGGRVDHADRSLAQDPSLARDAHGRVIPNPGNQAGPAAGRDTPNPQADAR